MGCLFSVSSPAAVAAAPASVDPDAAYERDLVEKQKELHDTLDAKTHECDACMRHLKVRGGARPFARAARRRARATRCAPAEERPETPACVHAPSPPPDRAEPSR